MLLFSLLEAVIYLIILDIISTLRTAWTISILDSAFATRAVWVPVTRGLLTSHTNLFWSLITSYLVGQVFSQVCFDPETDYIVFGVRGDKLVIVSYSFRALTIVIAGGCCYICYMSNVWDLNHNNIFSKHSLSFGRATWS